MSYQFTNFARSAYWNNNYQIGHLLKQIFRTDAFWRKKKWHRVEMQFFLQKGNSKLVGVNILVEKN